MIKEIEFQVRREPGGIKTVCLITLEDGTHVESIPNSATDYTSGALGNSTLYEKLCSEWGSDVVRELNGDEIVALNYHFWPELHPVEKKLLDLRARTTSDLD